MRESKYRIPNETSVLSSKDDWRNGIRRKIFELEAVSKPHIMFEGKARDGEKAQAYTLVCEHFEPTRNTAIGH